MALTIFGPTVSHPVPAPASLASSQYKLAYSASDGPRVLATAGGNSCGIIQNTAAANEAAELGASSGAFYPAMIGDTVTAGQQLVGDSSGRLVPLASGGKGLVAGGTVLTGAYVLAEAVEGGAVGDIVTVQWKPIGSVPTTIAV